MKNHDFTEVQDLNEVLQTLSETQRPINVFICKCENQVLAPNATTCSHNHYYSQGFAPKDVGSQEADDILQMSDAEKRLLMFFPSAKEMRAFIAELQVVHTPCELARILQRKLAQGVLTEEDAAKEEFFNRLLPFCVNGNSDMKFDNVRKHLKRFLRERAGCSQKDAPAEGDCCASN